MSKAVICDRCKLAFSEQNAMKIEAKWMFTTAHYDLCPICREELNKFMYPNKEDKQGERDV